MGSNPTGRRKRMMLGFSVHVEHGDKSIGFWTDDGEVHTSLMKLVKWGHAEVVEEKGGYPNIYRMKYKRLNLVLRYGIEPKTSHGFKLNTNYRFEDADEWVTFTLWDQS